MRKTIRRLGWGLDGWQDGAGMLTLALRSDGEYAADTIVISIPRQVGKTYLIGCIIFALCLMKPGLRVIWTAQIKDTALETYDKFYSMSQRGSVKSHIARTPRGNGDEAIVFLNGSQIEFGARDSYFGRGRTDIDILVFDEGQHLSNETLENMSAAQNVAHNPLCFVIGTPPRPRDKGEFFTLLRQEALAGESDGTLYIEMSADRGADPMDTDQWRKANPSFPLRTSERAMLRLRKKLKNPDSWRREALGIWDELDQLLAVIPVEVWSALAADEDARPAADTPASAWAVDMSHAGQIVIAGCWVTPGGRYVEVAEVMTDLQVAADWLFRAAGRRTPVVVDRMSPAAAIVPVLQQKRMRLEVTGAGEMARACGSFFNEAMAARLSHAGQDVLDDALAGARKRPIGDAGGWGWDRRVKDVDISPLVAVTLAHHGAVTTRPRGDASDGRGSVVLL